MPPQFSLTSITFSGGETVAFDPDSVVVIVGPNNSGKTTCLHEVPKWLTGGGYYYESPDLPGRPSLLVVKELKIAKSGTVDQIKVWLQKNVFLGQAGCDSEFCFRWLGGKCEHNSVEGSWKHERLGSLTGILCTVVDVEERLTVSKSPQSIESFQAPPEHPIHVLCRDDQIELDLSRFFREAFRTDLILKRAGGKTSSLHVGSRQDLGNNSDRACPNYLKQLVRYPELHQVGHGMRSFAGCLLHVLASPAFVLLIDEPEVFLHPPHARLLGTLLAREKLASRQLIIATHSADFLRGVIDSGHGNVKVIRITQEEGVNHAHELGAQQIQRLWADPILRFSNILDGLFHDLVVVCEGDADCRFYSAISDVLQPEPMGRRDILFTWTNGKHRLPTVVAALRGLDVPTRVVVDFDIFQEEQPLAKLVKDLGGDWASARTDWEFVHQSIEAKFPKLSPSEFGREIATILVKETGAELSAKGTERIREKLRAISPWGMAKLSGIGVVPNGQPTERLNSFLEKLRSIGLFVVEVGELERWVKSVGGKGPKFVSEVLSTKNLANDPELEPARKFVADLLSTKQQNGRSAPIARKLTAPSESSMTALPPSRTGPVTEGVEAHKPSEGKVPLLKRFFG